MLKQLLFAAFVFNSLLSTAQTFAPIGAKWHFSVIYPGNVHPQNRGYFLYECTKDTTYGGRSCRKLDLTHFRYDKAVIAHDPLFVYQSGDTVFYFNRDFNAYFPLYYFNAKLGDTLRFYDVHKFGGKDTTWEAVVEAVDSTVVDGVKVRHWYTTALSEAKYYVDTYSTLWGSDESLMHMLKSSYHENIPIRLRCYSDSTHAINFSSESCDLRTAANVDVYDKPDVELFPLPASTVLNIKMESGIPIEFRLVNVLGEKLTEGFFINSIELSLSGLTEGVYFITLKSGAREIQKKIIIVRN